MIASEVGRYVAIELRDPRAAVDILSDTQRLFQEMSRLPAFGPHIGPLRMPHEMNFNADYFPAAVAKQGPVWRNPLRDVPIAAFLEANYATFLEELQGILATEGGFQMLSHATRNAEPQFG